MNLSERIKFILGRTDVIEEKVMSMIGGMNTPFNPNKADSISTVFTCVRILSEHLSRFPLNVLQSFPDKGTVKLKDHNLFDLLHYNPNDYTTSQAFFAALETNRNLKGNAFARIHRSTGSGEVISLEIIPSDDVVGYNKEGGQLYYKIQISESKTEVVPSHDILHFRGVTKTGIWGMNPIESLRKNLSATHQALTTIDAFFQNGALSPYAMKSTVAGANQKAMLQALKDFQTSHAGASKAGTIIPLPPNTELQDLNISMADAEFINTVKFNADQIGALFGVPPYLLGNNEASKYSNIEQSQISFKVNTIASIVRMYRQELEFKLLPVKERSEGISIEFNVMAMVETDHKTRLDGYKTLTGIAAMSPKDVIKLEGLEVYEGSEKHYIQKQYQAIEDMKNPGATD